MGDPGRAGPGVCTSVLFMKGCVAILFNCLGNGVALVQVVGFGLCNHSKLTRKQSTVTLTLNTVLVHE